MATDAACPPIARPVQRGDLETARGLRPQGGLSAGRSDREFLIATNDYVDLLLLPRIVQRLQRDAP